eukprot:TRINITY_DN26311_c0_g1_i1.p1 TRINITY_DN26311_c0_g1~~TRINITY_DN26311_c0_g1_i1.p1  ORF type:complete len:518 (+),score=46.44 TRINITY_DN26311_c0_g1_i1:119-1672(+)
MDQRPMAALIAEPHFQIAGTEDVVTDESSPLGTWGSIEAILREHPVDVPGDESWISVVGMWLYCLPNFLVGLLAVRMPRLFVGLSIGRCCSVRQSMTSGRPLRLAVVWWWYLISCVLHLITTGSRMGVFQQMRHVFGLSEHWWFAGGLWCSSYERCAAITRSHQKRERAFGCLNAVTPEIFPPGLIIFLSAGSPGSEWAEIRTAMHRLFFDSHSESYRSRMARLPELVAKDWPNPGLEDLGTKSQGLVQRLVCKSVFFCMFGVWLENGDASVLRGWRTLASQFVLPRLVQRFMFNHSVRKVKRLRAESVGIIERYGLQDVFTRMNEALPSEYRRSTTVRLCDEIMFVAGFAGIGGTCACIESTGAFLNVRCPQECAPGAIDFGVYQTSADMVTAYKAAPVAYIKETCRLDPPVTSATQVLAESTEESIDGKRLTFPAGNLNSYCLFMANRDPNMFPDPAVFDPTRSNLWKALTWNGAFRGQPEDAVDFPRICPGRDMSLAIAQVIIDRAVGTFTDLE